MGDPTPDAPVCERRPTRFIDFGDTMTVKIDSTPFHVPTSLIKSRSLCIARAITKADEAGNALAYTDLAILGVHYSASTFSTYLQLLYGNNVVVCEHDGDHADVSSWVKRFELFRLAVDLQDSVSVNIIIDDMVDSLHRRGPEVAVLQCLFGPTTSEHRGWETPRKIFVDHAVHDWGDKWVDALQDLVCYMEFSTVVIKAFVAYRDRGKPTNEDYYQYFG